MLKQSFFLLRAVFISFLRAKKKRNKEKALAGKMLPHPVMSKWGMKYLQYCNPLWYKIFLPHHAYIGFYLFLPFK